MYDPVFLLRTESQDILATAATISNLLIELKLQLHPSIISGRLQIKKGSNIVCVVYDAGQVQ